MIAAVAVGAAFTLVACKPRDPLRTFRKAITKADTLWAYQVDGYPTPAQDQRKGVRYLYDYEVRKVHPLLVTEVAEAKASLLDSTTFDTGTVKSCPMVAQYALSVRDKGKTPIAVVVSTAPCGKALIFEAGEPSKPMHMELRVGNALEGILERMW